MENLSQRLVDKSIEAFLMGLEIYNKPTIRYRIEGFSFFIVNSWELMLKAELLNKGMNIYYPDTPERTLSVNEVIRKIYTDKNTPIRLNLEKIVELRNISTHYITEDYEAKYAPLFQACVLNFINEVQRFHKKDITQFISQNFLTLSASYEPLSHEQIRLKYSPEIAEKFIKQANEVDILSREFHSDKFSIGIRQNLYLTKKKINADFIVSLAKNSTNEVALVKELKDPADTHKYSYANVITVIRTRLKKQRIQFDSPSGFNSHVLRLVIKFYHIKQNETYAYAHQVGNSVSFTYSQQFIDFILNEIKKNPQTFYQSLRK